MVKYTINEDIKPRGIASAYVVAPFDDGKLALAKRGYNIISLQENAVLRMQEGAGEDVSENGNWVREGVVYVPEKGVYLTKNSPIMANAKKAINAHRNGQDFYLTEEQVERSLEGAVKLTNKAIPTNKFGENEITVYAFGEDAKRYGEFLKKAKIDEMPIWLTSIQEKPFARQMWFQGLGDFYRSGLVGNNWDLHNDDRVRGVRSGISAEGTAKILEAYTPSQIARVLKSQGLTGIEKALIDGLRQ